MNYWVGYDLPTVNPMTFCAGSIFPQLCSSPHKNIMLTTTNDRRAKRQNNHVDARGRDVDLFLPGRWNEDNSSSPRVPWKSIANNSHFLYSIDWVERDGFSSNLFKRPIWIQTIRIHAVIKIIRRYWKVITTKHLTSSFPVCCSATAVTTAATDGLPPWNPNLCILSLTPINAIHLLVFARYFTSLGPAARCDSNTRVIVWNATWRSAGKLPLLFISLCSAKSSINLKVKKQSAAHPCVGKRTEARHHRVAVSYVTLGGI